MFWPQAGQKSPSCFTPQLVQIALGSLPGGVASEPDLAPLADDPNSLAVPMSLPKPLMADVPRFDCRITLNTVGAGIETEN